VRPLLWYLGGLVATYVTALVVFRPSAGGSPGAPMFAGIMFAPTVGALSARLFGGGRIRWGRPSRWILAGLIPAVAALGAFLAAGLAGLVHLDVHVLRTALVTAPVAVAIASASALGEEIGWRGFLWPTLRKRAGFWRTSLIVGVVWWLYHLPLVLLGWYGSVPGLPAFTAAIAGFVLFVGVLTDRSGSLWPSVLAHGAWNATVATSFAVTAGGMTRPAFTGAESLLGEFGWLAAITTGVLGGLVACWHTMRPNGRGRFGGQALPASTSARS
jgi:membrane protease YdiL (CAAX protease family)